MSWVGVLVGGDLVGVDRVEGVCLASSSQSFSELAAHSTWFVIFVVSSANI